LSSKVMMESILGLPYSSEKYLLAI
jgi:hypothetical protein